MVGVGNKRVSGRHSTRCSGKGSAKSDYTCNNKSMQDEMSSDSEDYCSALEDFEEQIRRTERKKLEEERKKLVNKIREEEKLKLEELLKDEERRVDKTRGLKMNWRERRNKKGESKR